MSIKTENDLNKLAFDLFQKGLKAESDRVVSLIERLAKESPVKPKAPKTNDMSEFSNDGNFMTALNFGKVLTLAGGLHKEMDPEGNLSDKAYSILSDMKNRIDTILSSKKR